MPTVYWDIETFSQISLKEHGAYIYAAHASTGVYFVCYAIDDGAVKTWKPGNSIPDPFANSDGYRFVSDQWDFERAIHARILVERYGFPPLPIENQDCAQRLALASAYPAELGLRCEVLGLPYRKDAEARRAMLRLSRPQTAKKRKKPEDPAARERDLALLLQRCQTDVEATRAAYNSPRLRPLLPKERQLLLLDAKINESGIDANVPFLEAVRTLANTERNAVNVRLDELTAGVVTSVDQVARIRNAVSARGHDLATLSKRSVAAALALKPADAVVCELLELRNASAYTSVRMAKRLLAHTNPADRRIRGALRIYGAGPGRWSSPGPQLHNLRRNDAEYPACLVDALVAGDRAALERFGNPLGVVAELSRAALCAAPGHTLVCADLGAIESRVLAWFAGERWKLEAYRQYDRTGDKTIEPYRVIAGKMLRKDVAAITSPERQQGKCAELAAGFGGSVGAWRRIAGDDGRTDAEVAAIIQQWRDAHPMIRAFWRDLTRAARVAIRTGQPILVALAPRPSIIAAFDGYALTLTLPSGRVINYPGARLIPNAKFEDAEPDIEFFDNARGQWKRTRAWFGTLVENTVQACARDLLAAALLRFEARRLPAIFHCHDEVVIEVPEGAVSDKEVLAILLESPIWAVGLPLGGKVHSGPLYLEAPATAEPPPSTTKETVEHAIDAFVASADPLPATKEIDCGADEDFLTGLGETIAPLADFVTLPMDSSRRVSCPFHEDPNPSCSNCHACGARGGRLDWLMQVEGMTRDEALAALQDWSGPVTADLQQDAEKKIDFALSIWNAAQPLSSTIGERYLAETRGIDVSKLPPTIHDALRFHPALRLRGRSAPPLHYRPDAPPADRRTGWNSSHRIGTGEWRGHQDRPQGARLPGRGENVAGERRRSACLRRGDRDHARGRHPHLLSRRAAYAGLVGRVQEWARKPAGAGWHRAPHPPRGPRRERGRTARGRALPADLEGSWPRRGAADSQATGLGFQRRGAWEESMSSHKTATLPASLTFDDLVAYAPGRTCIYLPCKTHWPNASIDTRLPRQPLLDKNGNPVKNAKGKVMTIPASTWLEQNRSVEAQTWAPGEPELIRNKLAVEGGWVNKTGTTTLNTYRPPVIEAGDATQARRWVEHWHAIYPDDADHAIAWLASRVQHPEVKINHAIVLGGAPKIGKDTLLEPVKRAVGEWNYRDVALSNLISRNN
jgi:DNA polymerase